MSPVLKGELRDVRADLDKAQAHQQALEHLVGRLSSYALSQVAEDEIKEVAPLVDAARTVLEELYGRTITFAWERDREPSGLSVSGAAYADVVRGKLSGVSIGTMTEGTATGTAGARIVDAGGEVHGAGVERLGR